MRYARDANQRLSRPSRGTSKEVDMSLLAEHAAQPCAVYVSDTKRRTFQIVAQSTDPSPAFTLGVQVHLELAAKMLTQSGHACLYAKPHNTGVELSRAVMP